ncbi:MAG: hypothetical protein Q4E53_10165 [Eubacteriales bacterium]|nr:hypothetical protein [Eubacteriales bacterium]
MKFHRVLLFTNISMDVTPVGDDLHILLLGGDHPYLGCTAYATPAEEPEDPEKPESDISVLTTLENPEATFCIYVADKISKATGKTVLCTGGIYVDNPSEHEVAKLYENVDDLIKEWLFFNAD